MFFYFTREANQFHLMGPHLLIGLVAGSMVTLGSKKKSSDQFIHATDVEHLQCASCSVNWENNSEEIDNVFCP